MKGALLCLAFLASLSAVRPVRAQLISPGRLAASHAELEGVRNCSNCHELGNRGAAPARCLGCHEALAGRIRAGTGYHGRIAERPCTECHKEHLGREFQLVRWDTTRFDHMQTGWRLDGAHARTSCGTCHGPEYITDAAILAWGREHDVLKKTMLGLPGTCSGCHATADPHRDQFTGRGCDACHDAAGWSPAARFDHARAAYRLDGRHTDVECGACHAEAQSGGARHVRYTGVAYGTCASCHDDPHAGAMGSGCATCHATGGWAAVDRTRVERRFDHGRTAFPLEGQHERLACATCHSTRNSAARTAAGIRMRFVKGTERRTYPHPVADACAACHLDRHDGTLAISPDGVACEGCHTVHGWLPADYGLVRHDAVWALSGAHAVTPCTECHRSADNGAARFRIDDKSCIGCHRDVDPHGDAFGVQSCDACHDTRAFRMASFDHTRAGDLSCRTCHVQDDPHRGQFGTLDCASCHGTSSYRIAAFDHTRARFLLDGAHRRVDCVRCHGTESAADGARFTRWRPIPFACADCHGGTE